MVTKNKETYHAFKKRIGQEVMQHRVIVNNEYTKWFKESDLSFEDVKFFAKQFSVFSNLFLIAQLKKTINSLTLGEMRSSKEILANEIGVIFKPKTKENRDSIEKRSLNPEEEGDPELVSAEGTIEGGVFRFNAAHFEWLLAFGKPLGMGFNDMGKRRHGVSSTLFFCDELSRIYGSENFNVGAGGSFAVEHWAAAGFWKELVQGLRKFKTEKCPDLPLAFFTWHDKVEDQHAAHTEEELQKLYFHKEFNEDIFIKSANEMLDGVAAFWDGLNTERLERHSSHMVS